MTAINGVDVYMQTNLLSDWVPPRSPL